MYMMQHLFAKKKMQVKQPVAGLIEARGDKRLIFLLLRANQNLQLVAQLLPDATRPLQLLSKSIIALSFLDANFLPLSIDLRKSRQIVQKELRSVRQARNHQSHLFTPLISLSQSAITLVTVHSKRKKSTQTQITQVYAHLFAADLSGPPRKEKLAHLNRQKQEIQRTIKSPVTKFHLKLGNTLKMLVAPKCRIHIQKNLL